MSRSAKRYRRCLCGARLAGRHAGACKMARAARRATAPARVAALRAVLGSAKALRDAVARIRAAGKANRLAARLLREFK